jgi:hypothetical protein
MSPTGVDNIHSYPVEELNDGSIVLLARPSSFKNFKRVPQFAHCDLNADKRTFVVVGGGWKQKQKKENHEMTVFFFFFLLGAAGFSCVDNLRKEGYRGKLILICQENHLP